MDSILTADSLISLFTLTVLEVVLGIDNVIFVSILLGRIPVSRQLQARRIWMIAGITVRTLLLLGIGWLVTNGQKNFFSVFGYGFSLRNVIMLAGGLFLLYKTVKEIHARFETGDLPTGKPVRPGSFGSVISQIILIDTVFSFDSIVTAIGLAKKVPVMILAVIIAMITMFFFADKISRFIHKHPTLKMLALAFLLMVGFSLFFEGLEPIHHSHIDKGYIYFAMAFSFGVEMLNIWLRKRTKTAPVREG
jgi:predicted tellurium resistance membrane protein TerC